MQQRSLLHSRLFSATARVILLKVKIQGDMNETLYPTIFHRQYPI